MYPSLVLAYLGQGSQLIVNGDNVISNVFYRTIPGEHNGPLFWIVYVYAILATLIASQAMITAAFSLVQQLINMRSLPPYAYLLPGSCVCSRVSIQLPYGSYVRQESRPTLYPRCQLDP